MSDWDTLGIPEGSSPAAVRAAYLRLVKLCHPDTGGNSNEFVAVRAAYDRIRAAKAVGRGTFDVVPCGKCQGSGRVSAGSSGFNPAQKACGRCRGSGLIKRRKPF